MVDEVFNSALAQSRPHQRLTADQSGACRQTEHYARWLLENPASKVVFNTPEESAMVDEVFDSALAGLKPADRDLRIVQGIRPLLRAGIAMHHSGLLPILKEVIEILFQEGLVKVRPIPPSQGGGLRAAHRAGHPAAAARRLRNAPAACQLTHAGLPCCSLHPALHGHRPTSSPCTLQAVLVCLALRGRGAACQAQQHSLQSAWAGCRRRHG